MAILLSGIAPLACAQSPFLTGATSLQTEILTWLTPIAIILVMVLGAMAMANRVWVNTEQNSDTDFVLKVGHGEFAFQTTICDVPERRMGEDHKSDPAGSPRTRPYHPGRGSAEGPMWIAAAVRRKANANYSAASKLNLLVYANFPTNGLEYEVIRHEVAALAHPFASVWIVTNHQICSVGTATPCGSLEGLHFIYPSAIPVTSGAGARSLIRRFLPSPAIGLESTANCARCTS